MAKNPERATDEELARDNNGFLTSDDLRTGFITGTTFRNRPVQYSAVDGLAIFEGDIALGTVDEMERGSALLQAGAESDDSGIAFGVAITGDQYRWPNALMPYEIDSGLPNKARVTDAIAHWQANTNVRFVLRTAANASQYPNYVTSLQGRRLLVVRGHARRQTGSQPCERVRIRCSGPRVRSCVGAVARTEPGRSRLVRDNPVGQHQGGKENNFNQHISDGDDIGPQSAVTA